MSLMSYFKRKLFGNKNDVVADFPVEPDPQPAVQRVLVDEPVAANVSDMPATRTAVTPPPSVEASTAVINTPFGSVRFSTDVLPRKDAFDDFMDALCEADGSRWRNAKIAGVSHKNSDRTSRQRHIEDLSTRERLYLEREPNNRFSGNAVKIVDWEGHQLGYVPDYLSKDVAEALDRGGSAEAYVRHVSLSESMTYGVAIGIRWRVKLPPEEEFRATLGRRPDVHWSTWATVTRVDREGRQDVIRALERDTILTLTAEGDCVLLTDPLGRVVANLGKQHADTVRSGWDKSTRFEAIVFGVQARPSGRAFEPRVLILALRTV